MGGTSIRTGSLSGIGNYPKLLALAVILTALMGLTACGKDITGPTDGDLILPQPSWERVEIEVTWGVTNYVLLSGTADPAPKVDVRILKGEDVVYIRNKGLSMDQNSNCMAANCAEYFFYADVVGMKPGFATLAFTYRGQSRLWFIDVVPRKVPTPTP